jgi:hypothetical protein
MRSKLDSLVTHFEKCCRHSVGAAILHLMLARRTLAAMTLAVLALTACSSSGGADKHFQRVDSIQDPSQYTAAIQFSSFRLAEVDQPKSVIAFTNFDEPTSYLEDAPLDNGQLASNDFGEVSYATTKHFRVVGGEHERSYELGLGDTAPDGHWSGTRDDGSFVHVVEAGGDVIAFSEGPNGLIQSARSYTPGAFGIGGNYLYSISSSDDAVLTFYRTDLTKPGSTHKVSTFRPQQLKGTDMMTSANLFVHDGRAWFLEIREESEESKAKPHLNLASLDIKTGRYESTPVTRTNGKSAAAYAGNPRLGQSGGDSHFHRGSIFSMDHRGKFYSVDVATGTLRPRGDVRERALQAQNSLTAWQDNTMTLVYLTGDNRGFVERYEVKATGGVGYREYEGLTDFIKSGDYPVMNSMVLLRNE